MVGRDVTVVDGVSRELVKGDSLFAEVGSGTGTYVMGSVATYKCELSGNIVTVAGC